MEDGASVDVVLTVTEAAALLKVQPRLVRTMIHQGKLPAAKLGRVFRIARSQIDALLAMRKVPGDG